VSQDGGRRGGRFAVPLDVDDARLRAALASFLGGTVAVLPLLAGLIDAWSFLIAALIGSLGVLPIWRQVGAPLNRPLPLIAFGWLFIVGPAVVLQALSLLAFWTYMGAWVFTLGVLRFGEGSARAVAHVAETAPARPASLEFDRDLSALVDEFNDVLHVGHETRPEGADREGLKGRAVDVAARTRELSPPDADWREVQEDFVELMSVHLAHFGEVLPEAVQRRFAAITQRVNVRRQELREREQSQDR
jgi:hypothetical protein